MTVLQNQCIDALQRFFYISKTYMAPSLLYTYRLKNDIKFVKSITQPTEKIRDFFMHNDYWDTLSHWLSSDPS